LTRGSGHNEAARYSERPEDWTKNLERLYRKHYPAWKLAAARWLVYTFQCDPRQVLADNRCNQNRPKERQQQAGQQGRRHNGKNDGCKKTPKEPEPLEFERVSPTKIKIYGDFGKDEWVVFKELYFSRWKAYMNDKEVPVLANNHDLILIKTNEGKEIILEYSVLPIEKLFGLLSLIGFLGLILIFIFLL
jgi:hypothetical protein